MKQGLGPCFTPAPSKSPSSEGLGGGLVSLLILVHLVLRQLFDTDALQELLHLVACLVVGALGGVHRGTVPLCTLRLYG